MTPQELLALVERATPGNWEVKTFDFTPGKWWVDGPEALGYEGEISEADARLIALAPDLARLVTEMAEALEIITAEHRSLEAKAGAADFHGRAALASLDKLGEQDDPSPPIGHPTC